MAADILLYNQGIQYADGNIVTHAATYPASGSWTTGDIVLEQTSTTRLSGWKRITTGSGNVLGTDWVYCSNLISGTAQATTSGTSITFTGIPSWAKRVTVMLNGVSTNGTSVVQVQIGAGSVTSTGYSTSTTILVGAGIGSASITSGFAIDASNASITAASTRYGNLVLDTVGSNIWVASGVFGYTGSGNTSIVGGVLTLGGALDRVVLTTVNGTDAFDAGSINIMWE